jgi:quinol monooxygenase YgiN
MIVVRFKVTCQPGKREQAIAAFRDVIGASRGQRGILNFDIGQDLTDRDSFIAVEVFEDRAALDRQETLAATQAAIALLPDLVAAPPEATIYHVASSEPWA